MRGCSFAIALLGPLLLSASACATTTTIDFNTLPGAFDSVFTTYTESGFTVTAPDLGNINNDFLVATGVGSFGNPSPDIFTEGENTLTITDGGNPFTFESLDLGFFGAGTTVGYTITGFTGSNVDYTQTSSLSEANARTFLTLAGADPDIAVTSLTFAITSNNTLGANVDNIVVGTPAATPEPSSLALLGSGVLGVAGVLRKRMSKA
jgi:hypothetical protein